MLGGSYEIPFVILKISLYINECGINLYGENKNTGGSELTAVFHWSKHTNWCQN